jgi:hypothetical protein
MGKIHCNMNYVKGTVSDITLPLLCIRNSRYIFLSNQKIRQFLNWSDVGATFLYINLLVNTFLLSF